MLAARPVAAGAGCCSSRRPAGAGGAAGAIGAAGAPGAQAPSPVLWGAAQGGRCWRPGRWQQGRAWISEKYARSHTISDETSESLCTIVCTSDGTPPSSMTVDLIQTEPGSHVLIICSDRLSSNWTEDAAGEREREGGQCIIEHSFSILGNTRNIDRLGKHVRQPPEL